MKTKRLLLLLVLTLSSFFFFLDNVKADTYNYNIPNDPFSFHNDPNYETYLNSLLSYIDTQSLNNPHYFIYWRSNRYQAILIDGDTFTYTFDYGSIASDLHIRVDNVNVYYISNSNNIATPAGSSSNYTGNLINFACNNSSHNCDPFPFVATNATIINGSSDIVNLTYGDYTLTLPNSDNIYTMEQWYNSLFSEPYPLLSNFINVVIERLIFITSSLRNNYILLSCFTIFTLFFVLLLFRRLQ